MNHLNQLEETLNEYFGKKAPSLPPGVKEFIVKIAPYLVIIGVLITIPAILALFGLGGIAAGLAPYGTNLGVLLWVGILLLIPVVILEAMAIPGLFKRTAMAWRYLFWAQLISIAASVIQLNLISAVIGALIGFYLLFQIRSYYK